MAAYAALVSLGNVIDQLQRHPRPPISLNKQQVLSLTENIASLQEFLEIHNGGDGAKGLENRIADAAYAAEDIIESHIVDQILRESTSTGKKIFSGSTSRFKKILGRSTRTVKKILGGSAGLEQKVSLVDLYEGLQKIKEDMDSIKKEAKEVKQKPAHTSSRPVASSRSGRQESTAMVGMDEALNEMLDMLVGGLPNCKVIPITGMGGIGKTTLARNLYRNQTVVEHFHLLRWTTISQEYSVKEIMLQLLDRKLGEMDEHELGDKLHKELSGRRYLIILDDIWDIKIWERLKLYFPDYKNGSRIVLTTRLSNLASSMSDSHGIEVGFLSKDQSWNLFSNVVFAKEDCPLELETTGRKIVESCRGLPLSINVIGGHLAMSAQTQQHWEYIAENVSSIVNLEGNEHCLKILYTSYNSLPLYLKPCFLYVGAYPEDSVIRVSTLIRLWVAEGFLKPNGGKILEEVAEECLIELVERNLILVEDRNYSGKVKSFRIHDLLRDLCIRESRKEKFLYLPGVHSGDASQERRIWTNEKTELEGESALVSEALSVARSLIWSHEQLPRFGAGLLRLYSIYYLADRNSLSVEQHLVDVFKRVNLRYIDIGVVMGHKLSLQIPSSISFLWNLQTVVFHPRSGIVGPFEIWKLPQLRHVKISLATIELPSHPNHDDGFILENLHTLLTVHNLSFREDIVKRIPNIRKLGLYYLEFEELKSQDFNLNNIVHLSELNSLIITVDSDLCSEMQTLTLPNSLKKLHLYGTGLPWELITKMVGSLPLLESLQLLSGACVGREWITIKDHFRSLKLLDISNCKDLEYWETESSHFPRLEHVDLLGVRLKEIPSTLGDIATLRSFRLDICLRSAFDSAKRIREEQEELENLGLQFDLPSEDDYFFEDDE